MGFSPRSRPVKLIDGRTSSTVLVQATVVRDVPASHLLEVERIWKPAREAVAQALGLTGAAVEHADWDWVNKVLTTESRPHRIATVESGGVVQGLMAVLAEPQSTVLSPDGEPLLYVDYLETAPWNLKGLPTKPQVIGVGTDLIAEAVLMSVEAGWGGRIGLHSLAKAERFYQMSCQMTRLGEDPGYDNLVYFEFTEVQASAFLTKKGLLP